MFPEQLIKLTFWKVEDENYKKFKMVFIETHRILELKENWGSF
jgi:hypothetical protein